jgi:hypothetical protein
VLWDLVGEDSPTHGFDGGGGGGNVTGNSQVFLLPPGVTSSPTPPLLTLANPPVPHTATLSRSSTLKDVARAGGTSSGDQKEDKLTRTKLWIEGFLAQ